MWCGQFPLLVPPHQLHDGILSFFIVFQHLNSRGFLFQLINVFLVIIYVLLIWNLFCYSRYTDLCGRRCCYRIFPSFCFFFLFLLLFFRYNKIGTLVKLWLIGCGIISFTICFVYYSWECSKQVVRVFACFYNLISLRTNNKKKKHFYTFVWYNFRL